MTLSSRVQTSKMLPYGEKTIPSSFQNNKANTLINKTKLRPKEEKFKSVSIGTQVVSDKKIMENMKLMEDILSKESFDNFGK